MKNVIHRLLPAALAAVLLAGCAPSVPSAPGASGSQSVTGSQSLADPSGDFDDAEILDLAQANEGSQDPILPEDAYVDSTALDIVSLEEEAVALASSPPR